MRDRLAAILAALIIALPAWAQGGLDDDASARLSSVRLELETAEGEALRLADEVDALAERERMLARELVTLAAEERRREEAVAANRARLAALSAEESARSAEFAARRDDLETTLAALLRIARRPPEGLIAMPASLEDIYLSGRLIGGLVPTLESRAEEIARALDDLKRLHAEVAREQAALDGAHAALAAQQARVAALAEETARVRALLSQDQAAKAAQVAALAAEAADLQALIAEADALTRSDETSVVDLVESDVMEPEVAAEPVTTVAVLSAPPLPTGKPTGEEARELAAIAPAAGETQIASVDVSAGLAPSFSAAKGILPMPVVGRIVSGFGDTRGDGTTIKGLVVEAIEGAQVIAPFDGEIVYAGPFRDVGQLLIIAHGEDYHTVLAGFATILVATGQRVLAGEPVGLLGESAGGKVSLYVELRLGGEPIDPLPWISQHDEDRG